VVGCGASWWGDKWPPRRCSWWCVCCSCAACSILAPWTQASISTTGYTAKVAPEQKNFTPDQSYAVAEELSRRVQTLPGVQAASFASLVPLGGDSVGGNVSLKGRPDSEGPLVQLSNVGPGYFRAMGIGVRRGREFQAADRKGAPAVAIVNEAFARLFFPNGDALGKLVLPHTWESIPNRVGRSWAWLPTTSTPSTPKRPSPQLFSPFLQTGDGFFCKFERLPRRHAPSRPCGGSSRSSTNRCRRTFRTTRDAASLEFVLRRLSTALLAAMGMLGLLLSMIGLYGVLAWEVSRRTAEIGIRMALGASPGKVRRLVFRNALMPVGLGAGAGIGAAILVTLPLRSFLAGVNTTDPLTLGSVTAPAGVSQPGGQLVPGAPGDPDRPDGGTAERIVTASGSASPAGGVPTARGRSRPIARSRRATGPALCCQVRLSRRWWRQRFGRCCSCESAAPCRYRPRRCWPAG